MESYNFWQDVFDTYQSLSDWMKFAWLVVPPAFLLGFLAPVMRYRLAAKRAMEPDTGSLAYTVFCDENGILRIHAHDGADVSSEDMGTHTPLPLPGAHPRALAKPSPPTSETVRRACKRPGAQST